MCKKIGHWLYRQRWILFMLVLVGATVYFGFENNDFRDAFLFDKNGKFEWIGVSAIFAGVGLYLNAELKRKELKANIISRNELEILENFRQDCSKLNATVRIYSNRLDEILTEYGIYMFDMPEKNIPDFVEEELNKKIENLNTIYEKDISPCLNLVRLDSAINKKEKKTAFFKDSLDDLMKKLKHASSQLNFGNYTRKTFESDLCSINEANNKFLEDAQKYVNIVFKEQNDRIS